ncbi:MAG: MBL fold metallo-hydrolase [Dehalococcoidia bacterium]
MQVSPSVRAVQVPDDNPMHPQFTDIYLVGRGQVLTIDSGEAMDRYKWMLRGYLAATEKAEVAVAGITHHHADHSGNLKWMASELGAEVMVPRKAVPLLKGKLPKKRSTFMADGQMLDLGGGTRVQVLVTPGHSVDSVCYYIEEEGVLFSGDTILGVGTTVVNDLADYRQSLARLLALPNLKVMCPGHGPLIHDPRERIQTYIDHRNERERQILGVLAEGGEKTSWEIMLRLYPDVNPKLRRAADGNVRTHIRQLETEGRIRTYPGKPRRRSATTLRREEEHAKIRDQVMKQAARYDLQKRRGLLRAQENPPGDEWVVPPKFELV